MRSEHRFQSDEVPQSTHKVDVQAVHAIQIIVMTLNASEVSMDTTKIVMVIIVKSL